MARILIIDDVPVVRGVIRRLLESHGHDVLEASSGAEGTKVYFEDPVDLIITDILMEEGDGFEVIQTLHQENPDLKIIAMSGVCMEGEIDYLRVAKNLGAVTTLRKPFVNEEFLEAVECCLSN